MVWEGWIDVFIILERGLVVVDGLLMGFYELKVFYLLMLEILIGVVYLDISYRVVLE